MPVVSRSSPSDASSTRWRGAGYEACLNALDAAVDATPMPEEEEEVERPAWSGGPPVRLAEDEEDEDEEGDEEEGGGEAAAAPELLCELTRRGEEQLSEQVPDRRARGGVGKIGKSRHVCCLGILFNK